MPVVLSFLKIPFLLYLSCNDVLAVFSQKTALKSLSTVLPSIMFETVLAISEKYPFNSERQKSVEFASFAQRRQLSPTAPAENK